MNIEAIIAFFVHASVYDLIGLIGFFVYIAGFGALQTKLLDGNGAAYSLINIYAAALVLISLSEDFNLASALIQVSWILIGLIGITLRWRSLVRARRRPPTVRQGR